MESFFSITVCGDVILINQHKSWPPAFTRFVTVVAAAARCRSAILLLSSRISLHILELNSKQIFTPSASRCCERGEM